jgi:hypothetical protein
MCYERLHVLMSATLHTATLLMGSVLIRTPRFFRLEPAGLREGGLRGDSVPRSRQCPAGDSAASISLRCVGSSADLADIERAFQDVSRYAITSHDIPSLAPTARRRSGDCNHRSSGAFRGSGAVNGASGRACCVSPAQKNI